MALNVARTGRKRSSTGASRALNADELSTDLVGLIRDLQWREQVTQDEISRLTDVAAGLIRELTSDAAAKDIFRHGSGFEAVLTLLKNVGSLTNVWHDDSQRINTLAQMISSLLMVILEGLKDQWGNQKYFSAWLNGWQSLEESLENCHRHLLVISDAQLVSTVLTGLTYSLFALAACDESLEALQGGKDEDLAVIFTTKTLQNPQACSLAVRLALRLTTGQNEDPDKGFIEIAMTVLRMVLILVRSSTRNKVAIWQTNMLPSLLPMVFNDMKPSRLTPMLQELTLSLADLGFTTLDEVALLFHHARESDVARDLLLEILRTSKGPAFLQFDLTLCGYSSIELPNLPRAFPPTTGYTLTTWVRIDAFDPSCHTTLFGAFDATQACFVLLYLEKDSHQLILQTSIRSARPSVRFRSTRFDLKRWYHVALVHRKATADVRQSPAVLFIDGEFAEQVKCAYPEAPPDFEDRQLPSASASQNMRRAAPVQAFFGTPHDLALRIGPNHIKSQWSMASAHLYQAALTDEFLAVHHRLGPNYSGNLQDCLGPLLTYRASAELNRYNELLHPDKSDKSDIVTATESRGSEVMAESRLLLSISPKAVIMLNAADEGSGGATYELDRKALPRYQHLRQKTRAIAINAAIPSINEAISRSYGSGVLTGDPVVVVPKALDDASWCLAGGVPALVRLLESATTKKSFLQSVQIYFECVRDNWRVSEAMEKGSGFGMMAMITREKLGFETGASTYTVTRKPSPALSLEDRESMPLELLQLVLTFVGYDQNKPENSMIVNPMAYRVLLVDFDTWRRCDSKTQNLYYAQFVHFASHNKHQAFNQKRLTRMRVVKKLIEALKAEEIVADAVPLLIKALKALLDHGGAHTLYKDLAMFVHYGLQDERAQTLRPMHNMASVVSLRQRTANWARNARGSRPVTPGGQAPGTKLSTSRSELAICVLELLADIVCDDKTATTIRRFNRAVPNRWLLHLLAEPDVRVITITLRIISRALVVLGSEFKGPFVDKNGGFVTLKSRMKTFWKSMPIWLSCFAILFGRETPTIVTKDEIELFTLIETLGVDDKLNLTHPEILPAITAMLEAGLRSVTKVQDPAEQEAKLLKTIIQFLSELYARSVAFRDFAVSSRYVQELLFVLYPVLVGSDRLSAETELQAEKDSLSFKGEEVTMRPHSNSLDERPPSVRSMNIDDGKRTPSPMPRNQVKGPRRLSSFILVNSDSGKPNKSPARFAAGIVPETSGPVKINVGNATVEALLEVALNLFVDQICNKEKFNGIGLFMKVPPGFREHQAYFESYVLINALSQLWNHLQLNHALLVSTRVLTNLSRYSQHMAEALFEGWFIDGAQPVLEFTGHVLEYLQRPDIAVVNTVRLCNHYTSAIRVVFLRVTLWRLSELDETANEDEAVAFLNKMNYWQTILFSSDNQETLFIRLICFLLYMKLVSDVRTVRLAAARLWRTILVQKPTESATLLTYAMGTDQRHLSTGFMKLVSMDDEEFISWIDENRTRLDTVFIDALSKPWDDFVNEENKRNEETAKGRLSKRREKLRQWQTEEATADDFMHRYEISTNHWRSNVHAQERLKLQRALQDHQETVNNLSTAFSRVERLMRQPCSLEPATDSPKWQLDETESANRMRMRTVPDTSESKDSVYLPKRKMSERRPNANLAINTQISRVVSENIMSPYPNSPLTPGDTDGAHEQTDAIKSRTDSASNSQLLEGGFEIVDDPKEDDDGLIEDKNRKILTSLQRGDMVQQLYNISRLVGLEACEGLLVVGKKCLYLQDNFFQRSDGEIVSVSSAPEDERDPYVQLISGKDVGSSKTKNSIGDQETRHWAWTEVLSVSKRHFLFRDVSIEAFFTDGRSYLLTCMSPKIRDDLYSAILSRAPHVHNTSALSSEDSWRLDTLRNPEEGPQSLGSKFASVFNSAPSLAATKKWVKGEMSNFQYLMLINTMAGRTFNDLTQYPVFPWVLADYASEELDLSNPKTFRDFSKPMGCQTRARAAEYRDRFKQFAEMGDQNAPPFHYGTHYSSAMIVSSYLIRLQPFVQSYLLLQGGNFDHADRLFDSIEKAWLSASKDTMSDVRELTPEFFYLPEFLVNMNKYDFGVKQGDGGAVNDVKLPRWAKGDPHIFIMKHREALESPYVSEHLHGWIDLVFGYKQRGEAAIEATNVFQHLSYDGARDLDAINDPVERLATIGIIHSFGQTPYQIFQRSHPARELGRSSISRLDQMAESLIRLPDPLFESDEKVSGLTFSSTQERLLCAGPCMLNILPHCDRFVQWGFADHSLRFFSSNTKRLLGLYENTHIGPISCAAFADSKTLITGGIDCSVAVWSVSASRDQIEIQPRTYLFGHRTSITILTASPVCSTLLSASADGRVVLWGLNRLTCIRVLRPAGSPPIQAARVSNVSGHILLCEGGHALVYTLNGQLLLRQDLCDGRDERLVSCAFYEGAGNAWLERELIFTGHEHGTANVWTLTTLSDGAWYLQLVKRLNHTDHGWEDGRNSAAAITAILPMPQAVYTGDEEGRVWEWDCVQRHTSFSTRGR